MGEQGSRCGVLYRRTAHDKWLSGEVYRLSSERRFGLLSHRALGRQQQPFETLASERADGNATVTSCQGPGLWRREQVGLVEHEQAGDVAQPQLLQQPLDDVLLVLDVLVGGVDDVEQQVGIAELLERGAERGDQIRREIRDEADRVRDRSPRPRAGSASGGSSGRGS